MTSTASIYDAHAAKWARRSRLLLSDFTARPQVLDHLGPVTNKHVIDLGCGEGYLARLIAEAGAASVFGVDVSTEMINNARAMTSESAVCDLRFAVGDAVTYRDFPRPQFDLAISVFLMNYLTRAQMTAVMATARQSLTAGGRFLFTVPHPCLAYMRMPEPPFFFDTEGLNYFEGIDTTYEGRMWRRDGVDVPVRCVHKTFADYFSAMAAAGFTSLPIVVELAVTEEHLALDPDFFEPLRGYPLHVLFCMDVL